MQPASVRNCLVIFFILAASVRFAGLGEKQLWVDEIIQAIHSKPDSIPEVLKGVAQDKGGSPLDYIVQHFAMKVSGTRSEASARFHAALFGSVSVVLVYVLAIQLFKQRRIAVLSAVFYGLFPLHHHYSQEGRPYALFVMLVLILFILYVRAREQGSWNYLLWMFFCSVLSFYTHPFTALVFAAMLSIGCIRLKMGREKKIGRGILIPLISGVLAGCAYIPWLFYSIGSTRGDYPHPLSLHLIPEVIQGFGDGSYPVALILLGLAGIGILYLRKNSRDVLIDLSCWVLVPIPLILLIISWRSYFFAARQLLFVTPALILFAACGMEQLLCSYGKKAMAVPAVYALICLTVIGLHYPDRRTDLRGVGRYLQQTVQKGDGIMAPNSLGLLSYYFPDIYGYEKTLSSITDIPGGKRLFLIVAPYASAAEQSELWNVRKQMVQQEQLSYRGISIFVLSPKASK